MTLTNHFWGIVCKTWFALCYQTVVCPVCLSVMFCIMAKWLDQSKVFQDETWHLGRPRPWPHCIRWGTSSHSREGAQLLPIFGPYLLWPNGGWIKIPLRMEVDLGPGDFVLDGDPACPAQKGDGALLPNFWPMSIVAKLLDGS